MRVVVYVARSCAEKAFPKMLDGYVYRNGNCLGVKHSVDQMGDGREGDPTPPYLAKNRSLTIMRHIGANSNCECIGDSARTEGLLDQT